MVTRSDDATTESSRSADEAPSVNSAEDALARLVEGNRRFVAGQQTVRDHVATRDRLVAGQNPLAIVLRCADSRTAPEIIFDQGLGSLFVCAVAGQIPTQELVASMEYAVTQLETPLIVVMGHTGCGAVQAAVDHFDSDEGLPGSLPSLVARIRPAVEDARARGVHDLSGAVAANVRLGIRRLTEMSDIIRDGVAAGTLVLVGGVHDLKTGVFSLISP